MLSAIVLAAGESKRMGTPKPLLKLGGRAFLEVICGRLRDAGLDEVIAVLGGRGKEIRAALRLPGVRIVMNREFARGQLSSLRCGLRAVSRRASGALVTLVDHPLVAAATYAGLVKAMDEAPDKIIIASYRGKGGHPVGFPRTVFAELLNAPDDEGARAVVRKDPGRVTRVAFEDPGIVADIDRPEDYKRIAKGGAEVHERGA